MHLTKNDFIICLDSQKKKEYELCLVEEDCHPDETEINIILFKRKATGFEFEPDMHGIRNKDQVLMSRVDFDLFTMDESEDMEESCFAKYKYTERHFMKKLKEARSRREEGSESDEESQEMEKPRGQLKILGKKADLEINKKIKVAKSQSSKASSIHFYNSSSFE